MKSTIKITEGELEFLFNEEVWDDVVKFDEHPDYKNIEKIGSLRALDEVGNTTSYCGIKAIDFLGVQKNGRLFMIEVKDFKNYRIESKERLKNAGENLMTEVAYKVKDSIACIIGAQLNSTHDIDFWKKAASSLIKQTNDIVVILWLELDNTVIATNSIRRKNKIKKRQDSIGIYRRKLRQKLKWLVDKSSNVKILNIENYQEDLAIKVKRITPTPHT